MMNNEPGNETPQISVVIPVLNQQGNIGPLVDEIHDALAENLCHQVLVDDDASTDGTRNEVADAAAATADVNAVLGGDGQNDEVFA